MTHSGTWIGRWIGRTAPVLLLLAGTPNLLAHAILVRSTPANGAVVDQPDLEMTLDYNARIDTHRSNLVLIGPGDQKIIMQREPSSKPNELKAKAVDLVSGPYRIEWQALASDGHITRGEVTFTVRTKSTSVKNLSNQAR